MTKKKIKTIVLPVGGLGTRFLPATKATPKEMLPVAEKPLVQYAFEEALEAGIEKFIFVTGRNKNAIENHFDHAFELQATLSKKKKDEMLEKTIGWLPKAGHISFIRQQNPLGLGHAVLCAKRFVGNEPFIVSLADVMLYKKKGNFLKDMINLYNKKEANSNIVALDRVKEKKDVSKYGIIKPKKQTGSIFEIETMIEKPSVQEAPSQISVTGRYLLQPEIFDHLEKTKPGRGNEIQLTDAMVKLMKKQPFYGLEFPDTRFDCGSILGYLEANITYAMENPKIKSDVEKMVSNFAKKIGKI